MASGSRGITGLASLILIAGSIVLLFFVVLSGVKHATPLDKVYFLQADTSTIRGARPLSQWTFFYVCGEGNTNCGAPVPGLSLGDAWVNGGAGAPASLVGPHAKNTTSKYYFYMWRFGWVLYLIALAFDVLAFFTALLAPISRLASGLAGLTLGFALFWMSIAAALMTTVFVKARNEFRSANINAQIGKYAFGFTWGAWFAMLLATILLFLGVSLGRDRHHSRRGSNARFFRRHRRQSVRRSFIDNDGQRRVKEEY